MAELRYMKTETSEPGAHDWTSLLSSADGEACLQDLATAAGPERIEAELRAWRETATAIVAGLGCSEHEWLDEGPEVEHL